MNFPSNLTEHLLEFVLDNHSHVQTASLAVRHHIRSDSTQALRTGIEDILVDTINAPTIKPPPPPQIATAVAEATEAIWHTVLDTFDDNVWLENDERIVFFARWKTSLKHDVTTLLTQLLEDR